MRIILLGLIKITLLAAIIAWFGRYPGLVQVNWLGWQLDLSVGMALAATFALFWVILGLYRCLYWLFGLRKAWKEHRIRRHHQLGLQALQEGQEALSQHKASQALDQANKARSHLADHPLALLLHAQALSQQGDTAQAAGLFANLTQQKHTANLACGQLLDLWEEAGADNPDLAALITRHLGNNKLITPDLQCRYLLLQAQYTADWASFVAGLDTLAKPSSSQLPLADATASKLLFGTANLPAALLTPEKPTGLLALDHGKAISSLTNWLKVTDSTNFDAGPALLLCLLLLHHAANQKKKATSLVEKYWPTMAQPLLGYSYCQLFGDTLLERVKMADHLAKITPQNPAGLLVAAKAALDADLWGKARSDLQPILDNKTTMASAYPTACLLMAEIALREFHDEKTACQWYGKAASLVAEGQKTSKSALAISGSAA